MLHVLPQPSFRDGPAESAEMPTALSGWSDPVLRRGKNGRSKLPWHAMCIVLARSQKLQPVETKARVYVRHGAVQHDQELPVPEAIAPAQFHGELNGTHCKPN